MPSQTPDVEVPSLDTDNSVPSPATPSPSALHRESPDRPSGNAPAKETTSTAVATTVAADPRCQYRYQNSTRCRLQAADSESGLCARHLRQKLAAILPSFPDDTADLSAELLPELSEFDTATPINKYLERLLVLATKGRVSPRRASVLGFLTSQLLHSVHAMDREEATQSETIIFDLPRPKRD